MSGRNGTEGDIEITLADGSVLALALDPESDPNWKPGTPYSLQSVLSASAAQDTANQRLATPVSNRLVTRQYGQADIRKGMGLGYNAAYGLWTRDGYVMPAGAASGVQLTGIGLTHTTASPIVAFAEYNSDLYVAQQGLGSGNGGRVLKITGGTGTAAESMSLAAGDLIRDLLVADDGSGTTVLFATSESATHTNGRLHKYDGATWTHTTAGVDFAAGRGLGRMAYEFMQPDPSVSGDWRILALTGAKKFAYTVPFADPMTGTATWITDTKVGTQGSLLEIVAARRHFWFGATDNLYDIDEAANSMSLTSYTRQMQQIGNGLAVLYMDGWVYMSLGRGLVRVRVDQGAVLSEKPQQCAPGWGTPAENDVRGYVTAMCPDQGGFFTATYNPSTKMSYICWNVLRDFDDPRTRNPLVAHGPEVVFDVDYKVTRMWTSGLDATTGLRLWIASQSVGGGTARLDWVYLPIAGSPLQDMVSPDPSTGATLMKFCTGAAGNVVQPFCRLEMLRDDWDDSAGNTILYQDTVVSRGLSVVGGVDDGNGTKFTLYSRADPPPGSTTWTSAGDVAGSPYQDVIQASVVQGHMTQLRVDFFSPQGGASTPKVGVLEAVRRLGWHEVPSVRVYTLPVKYGDGTTTNPQMDPDDITTLLKTATESTKLTIRDRWNKRWTVKLDQVLNLAEELHDGGNWGKTVHATLQIVYLGVAA